MKHLITQKLKKKNLLRSKEKMDLKTYIYDYLTASTLQKIVALCIYLANSSFCLQCLRFHVKTFETQIIEINLLATVVRTNLPIIQQKHWIVINHACKLANPKPKNQKFGKRFRPRGQPLRVERSIIMLTGCGNFVDSAKRGLLRTKGPWSNGHWSKWDLNSATGVRVPSRSHRDHGWRP